MKAAHVFLALLSGVAAVSEQKNPLGAVLDLMADLKAKIMKEAEAEDKAYKDFFNWCDGQSRNLNQDIKTEHRDEEKDEAKIDKLTSSVGVSETKIEELASAQSTAEAELKDATAIRKKEAEDFKASEQELMDGIDTLDRAMMIIDKEMSKGGAASLAQIDTSNMEKVVKTIGAVVEAAGFTTNDKEKLVALMQARNGEDEISLSAPSASAYESHSSGITDMLQDMKEQAESELAEARKQEMKSSFQYNMMQTSLNDEISTDEKDLSDEKSSKAGSEEERAVSKNDLKSVEGELKVSTGDLEDIKADCITAAADHEATVKSREEELKVIEKATEILNESTGGAQKQSYSLLQVGTQLRTRADLANAEILAMVKKLAKEQHSMALNQLASRIAVTLRFGATMGEDPFAKVKGLLSDMIVRLENEAAEEASEKQYCDEEMSKTEAKKEDVDDNTAKVMSQIDKAAARSASLKEQVAELQSELGELSKSQAEMDRLRQEEHADYTVAKEELEAGLGGVRRALEVLRDYYGNSAALIQTQTQTDDKEDSLDFMDQPSPPQKHAAASGAGGSIIGMLEVVESDFATNLAKEETEEADAAQDYEKTSKANALTKTSKEADVKYKTQDAAGLDKDISQLGIDKENLVNEQAAVLEYYGKIKSRCIAEPESYKEKTARREAEIEGLKDALQTLNGEAAFIQGRAKGRKGRFMGY